MNCIYILDESDGLPEPSSGKTNVIRLEPCPGDNERSPLPYPLKISVDQGAAQYIDVKIKLELPEKNKAARKKRKKLGLDAFCDVCGKNFAPGRLARHRETHNEQRERFTCDICPQTCSDKWTLARHKTIHNGYKPFICIICDKTFANSTGLKRHLTCHDPDSRPYECNQCPQKFPDQSSMRKHLILHSGIRSHVCEICDKSFSVIGDLNLHKKCHQTEKPYACEVCGREFSRNSNLVRHKTVHKTLGTEIYTCEVCNVHFQHGGTLTRHIISAHPIKKKTIEKKLVKVNNSQDVPASESREIVELPPEVPQLILQE